MLGAVGGPKWDDPNAKTRPEKGLLAIRKGLGLYANLRPVKSYPRARSSRRRSSPSASRASNMLLLRELTGGLYFGKQYREKTESGTKVVDTLEYIDIEIRAWCRLAFNWRAAAARSSPRSTRPTCSSRRACGARSRSSWAKSSATSRSSTSWSIACAMRLVTAPGSFDVMVTENMFGDILSDEAAVLTGSLGMLPSASLGEGKLGLYEPIHGSAPDIAGKGICNPLGTIFERAPCCCATASVSTPKPSSIERAVEGALATGARTKDLGGANPLSTQAMTDAVLAQLEE